MIYSISYIYMYPICPILIMILYICRHTQSHMPLFMPRIERAGLCVHRVARDSAVAQAVRSLVGWPGPGLERISGGPQLWGSHGIPGTGWCWMLLIGTWISMIHWQVALSHVGLDSLQRLGSAALFWLVQTTIDSNFERENNDDPSDLGIFGCNI